MVSLNASGLVESGAFRPSPSDAIRLDELLIFDNTVARRNKSAAEIYYYRNGAWRQVGAGSADQGNRLIFTPGTGFILRSGSGAASAVWVNVPEF